MFDFKKTKGALLSAKGSSILLLVGMGGVLLIFLSQFWSTPSSKQTANTSTAKITTVDYAKQLEGNLRGIIGNIQGVGRVQVLVTLESGVQYVYEQNQKSTNNRTTASGDNAQTQENTNTEQDTVLADNGNGAQQPLIKTEMQPPVKGVVVVCDGGNDPTVQDEVLQTVMTALNLQATSISISPMTPKAQTASR
ncbi:MAG: stage III sporulation protein AG [Ethanoligenens sp.]|uniref:stage III sporulation protein AG n=1 Tax=Ethanoligenens sp. TaxID=2099655 RepID=UPI0039EB7261